MPGTGQQLPRCPHRAMSEWCSRQCGRGCRTICGVGDMQFLLQLVRGFFTGGGWLADHRTQQSTIWDRRSKISQSWFSCETIGNHSPSDAYLTRQQMLQQHETESQQQGQQEQPTTSTQAMGLAAADAAGGPSMQFLLQLVKGFLRGAC